MGRPISLFSGYSQKENRTTNYCLLVLKMLYDERPRFFAEALASIIGEDIADQIGMNFRQQEKSVKSVPDGLIVQKPIAIFLETKNYDWFNDSQLQNHLEGLSQSNSGLKVLIALGNFEPNEQRFEQIEKTCKSKYNGSILFIASTFEDFISALALPDLPQSLVQAVAELREYLDEEGLLSSWHTKLDVVNCAAYPEDVLDHGVYICPTIGGAYSHARCKYFGMYRRKIVEVIAEIRAVIDVNSGTETALKWANTKTNIEELKTEAIELLKKRRPGVSEGRVFLLGARIETHFSKDSPGGMRGSKQYFNVSSYKLETAEQLARTLQGKKWSEVSDV